MRFDQTGDFAAKVAAEAYIKAQGWSIGSSQRGAPRGILFEPDVLIAKWRNLTVAERAECDGTLEGDMRNGPVVIKLKDMP